MGYKIGCLFFILLVFYNPKTIAQDTKSEMALYNMGLGGLAGGIGALINKKTGEKTGKIFLKGFSKGALGGFLVFQSKNLIGKIENKQTLGYSWAGKLVNSAGTSIIEGASLNNKFLSTWHLHIGFNRFEFNTHNRFKLKYRIMPVSFVLTTYAAFGNKFEVGNSLRTGEFLFSNSNINRNSGLSVGVNYANVIVYNNTLSTSYSTIAHEIIHTYQYYDFNFINVYLDKPIKQLESSSEFFKKLNKYLYYDLQGPVLRGLYLMEGTNNENYYDNFFENEAGFWTNTIR